mmetsp:Transcript_13113/g.16206  ORF Transcript_13113/g.16206 Transcript_13113/m.16206 type:complete len:85 (+) Transcript_13113:158-412(+)
MLFNKLLSILFIILSILSINVNSWGGYGRIGRRYGIGYGYGGYRRGFYGGHRFGYSRYSSYRYGYYGGHKKHGYGYGGGYGYWR